MSLPITSIDHVAITAENLDESCRFYKKILGARIVHEFVDVNGIVARQLRIGGAMLNMHRTGHGHPLVAAKPTPGAVDLCFSWAEPISSAVQHLRSCGVEIIEGPSKRTASNGEEGLSVYFRDPDGNLLELLSTWKDPSA